MDRRHAIKNIGLSMGVVIATPTIVSLLQSCQNEPEWFPEFFSQEEGTVIKKLVDIILPKTDTPSGSEVNTPQFIDIFTNEIMEPEQQELMRNAMNVFTKKALSVSGKDDITKLKEKDLEPILASSLKVTKEQQEETYKKFGEYMGAIEAGQQVSIDDETLIFVFLDNLRGLAIWGYKTNEIIGKEVLAYDPIPGRQEGCVDLNEATGGKAWSL